MTGEVPARPAREFPHLGCDGAAAAVSGEPPGLRVDDDRDITPARRRHECLGDLGGQGPLGVVRDDDDVDEPDEIEAEPDEPLRIRGTDRRRLLAIEPHELPSLRVHP